MKFFAKTIVIGVLALLLGPFFHLWAAAVISLIVNFAIRTNSLSTFFSGFLGVGLTWYFYSLYLVSNGSEAIAGKVAAVFGLSSGLLILVGALLGGIIGGLGGATARSIYRLFEKKKYNPYH